MPAIPPGYRIKVPRLAIDLPLAEGDIERDAVRQQTPENFAFHLPGSALPGDSGNAYFYAHARAGIGAILPAGVHRDRPKGGLPHSAEGDGDGSVHRVGEALGREARACAFMKEAPPEYGMPRPARASRYCSSRAED